MTYCNNILCSCNQTSCLKTHICESATPRLMVQRRPPISYGYAISLNVDWAGPMGKRTIWTFERSPRTCLGPQALFTCLLNQLYSHSAKRCMERNWGSHHWNSSLCAADLLNDDCKSLIIAVTYKIYCNCGSMMDFCV